MRLRHERKPLFEVLTDEQHVSALESVFAEGPIVGYENMLKSLQKGYEAIGYKRGRNVCVELNNVPDGKRGNNQKGQDLLLRT